VSEHDAHSDRRRTSGTPSKKRRHYITYVLKWKEQDMA
jgi:hypothetical protein